MQDNFDKIMEITGAKEKKQGQYLGHCPAHDDKNPSLSLSLKNNKILLKCHAGCSQEAILQSLPPNSLTSSNEKPQQKFKLKQTDYLYDDFSGKPHLKVTRVDFSDGSKSFYQKYLDKGKYKSGSNRLPIRPYLYEEWVNKPQVILVEGEKCVEKLRSIGLNATCVPKGANGWKKNFNKYFRNKQIIIIPDNDEPGKKFAKAAGKDLCEVAAVKVLELDGIKEKEDIYDWLESGNTKDGLLCHIEKNAIPVTDWLEDLKNSSDIFNCVNLGDVEPKDVTWLWEPYIPKCEITMVEGDPECGKSWLTMAIAAAVTRGQMKLESTSFPFPKGSVLIFSCEDSLNKVQAKRFKMLGADTTKIISVPDPIALNEEGFTKLSNTLNKYKPILTVLNPAQAYMGDIDMNSAGDVRPILSKLQNLCEKHGTTVIIVRHLKKGSDKSAYKGMGSIDFFAASRSVLMMGRDPDNKNEGAVLHTKSNLGKRGENLGFKFDDKGFHLSPTTQLEYNDIMRPEAFSQETKSALEEAKDFLIEELRHGPAKSKDILLAAQSNSIGKTTLKAAKKLLGIQSVKLHDAWTMILPENWEGVEGVEESGPQNERLLDPLVPTSSENQSKLNPSEVLL